MRIGLVVEHFDPGRGGAEQWTWQFASWLAGKGHKPHVLASTIRPGAETLGVACHLLGAACSREDFAQRASRKLAAIALDAVLDTGAGWHCHVFQPHGGSRRASFEQNLLLAPAWARPFKRGLAKCLPRYREFDRLTALQYDPRGKLFAALSQMVARDFVRHHGVPEERIRLVYNGVDVDRFSPSHRARWRRVMREKLGLGDELLILIVAHNHRLKGVPSLVAAVGRLLKEGRRVRLAVVGGRKGRFGQALVRRYSAEGAVLFAGSAADPVPWYAAADVYVQPTFYDPCSLVVLEALASGLPVVTSRFNGAGELLTEGLEGYLVGNPADSSELADALRRLLRADDRHRMGELARRLAEAHDWDRNGHEMLSVLAEAADLFPSVSTAHASRAA
jgi:UDP-glucose:(heptosyl)LPS alpha-1,3-glucosyltransferase